MLDNKEKFLIEKAKELMKLSRDPVHDLSHVERVVENVRKISPSFNLTDEEQEAVELAAWWHDVARVLTKQPSFVWMACIDDMLSALMLCIHSIRYGYWKKSGGVATKLILSKTFGTGAIFTKLLLINKRKRTLVNILKDADQLDVMHVERLTRVCELSRTSKKYLWGLHCLMFYNTRDSVIQMRTSIAHQYLLEAIERLLKWICEHRDDPAYVSLLGKERIENSIEKFTHLHRKLAPIAETI